MGGGRGGGLVLFVLAALALVMPAASQTEQEEGRTVVQVCEVDFDFTTHSPGGPPPAQTAFACGPSPEGFDRVALLVTWASQHPIVLGADVSVELLNATAEVLLACDVGTGPAAAPPETCAGEVPIVPSELTLRYTGSGNVIASGSVNVSRPNSTTTTVAPTPTPPAGTGTDTEEGNNAAPAASSIWLAVALLAAALLAGGLARWLVVKRRRGAERYRVVRELGAGSFGRTWLAEDARLKRRVVIKELHAAAKAEPATRSLLLREAQAVAMLSHPNVVTIYDVEVDGPSPRVVMEYVEGGSLAERLRQGPLPASEAIRLADGLLQGLGRVHAEGITHRDIKPANILLTRDGQGKIADFGIARLPHGGDTLTPTGGMMGTPLYMSPEQVRGEAADARSDLYALAAVLHETLTGERTAPAMQSVEALQRATLSEPPRLSPRLSPTVRAVLEKALARDPALRYQSAGDLRAALLAVQD